MQKKQKAEAAMYPDPDAWYLLPLRSNLQMEDMHQFFLDNDLFSLFLNMVSSISKIKIVPRRGILATFETYLTNHSKFQSSQHYEDIN